MSILVLLEHDGGRVRSVSLRAVSCARQLAEQAGEPVELLLLGVGLEALLPGVAGLNQSAVVLVEHPGLAGAVADRAAAAAASAVRARGASTLLAAASTFARDVLPRVAALLDAPMVTEILAVEPGPGGARYRRPVYAGAATALVEVEGPRRVLSCRPSAFPEPPVSPGGPACSGEIARVDPGPLPAGTELVSRETRTSDRPELSEARVVVSGGRPFGDPETFLRLVGGLADVLGGAIGATRAAVDAGLAPNDWQVGQTGKVVAPELYIACGVSGAVQHLAGMKDSRVIAAINRDPEAPIFQVASYGLVADVFEAVPALTEALRRAREE